jgi:hypothetical protein
MSKKQSLVGFGLTVGAATRVRCVRKQDNDIRRVEAWRAPKHMRMLSKRIKQTAAPSD